MNIHNLPLRRIISVALTTTLFGVVLSGCSGGGSSGGGGGSTSPNNNPNGTPQQQPTTTPGAFVAVSMNDPVYDTQVNSGAQVNVALTNVAGDPQPQYAITEVGTNRPLGGGTITGTSLNTTIQAPTLNVGDPNLVWNTLVTVSNAHQGVTSEVQKNMTIMVVAPTSGGGGTTLPSMPPISVELGGRDVYHAYPSKQRLHIRMSMAGLNLSQINVTIAGLACEVVNKDSPAGFNVLLPAGINVTGLQQVVVSAPGVYSGSSSATVNVVNNNFTFSVMDRQDLLNTADFGRVGIATVTSSGLTTTITNESAGNGHYHPATSIPLSLNARFFAYPSQHAARPAVALIDATVNQGATPVVDLEDVSTNNGTMLFGGVGHNGEIAVLWRDNTTGKLALSVLTRNNQELNVLRTIQFDGNGGRPDYVSSTKVGSFLEVVYHRFNSTIEQNWACFGNVDDKKLVLVGLSDGTVFEQSATVYPQHGVAGVNGTTKYDELMLVGNDPATNVLQISRVVFSEGGFAPSVAEGLTNTPTGTTGVAKSIFTPPMFYTAAGEFHIVISFIGSTGVDVFKVDFDANPTPTSTLVAGDTTTTGYTTRTMAFIPDVGLAVAASGTFSELRLYPFASLTNNAQFTAPRVITEGAKPHTLIATQFSFLWEVRNSPGTDSLLTYNRSDFNAVGTAPSSLTNFAFDAPVTLESYGAAGNNLIPNFSR